MAQQPPTYYTVVWFGLGCYVKFIDPVNFRIEATVKAYNDPGEASKEFLKDHPGAQYLVEARFTHKAYKLEQQYYADLAKLRAWNGGSI